MLSIFFWEKKLINKNENLKNKLWNLVNFFYVYSITYLQ